MVTTSLRHAVGSHRRSRFGRRPCFGPAGRGDAEAGQPATPTRCARHRGHRAVVIWRAEWLPEGGRSVKYGGSGPPAADTVGGRVSRIGSLLKLFGNCPGSRLPPDRRPESVMVSELGGVTARPKESFDMTSADRFEGIGGLCHP